MLLKSAQFPLQGEGGKIASSRRLGEALEADGLECGGDGRVQLGWSHRLLVGHFVQNLSDARSDEWGTSCQQLIKNGSQGIDITPGADVLVTGLGLFWGHVIGCAQDLAVQSQGWVHLGLGILGHAEIADVRISALVEQHVGGLEIPVKHAFEMRVMNGARQDFDDACRAAWSGAIRVEQLEQIAALEQPHDEVGLSVVILEIVDWGDVGMIQTPGDADFPEQTSNLCGVRDGGAEEFQGDLGVMMCVPGLEHGSRGAPAEFPENLETSDAGAACG